MGIEVKLTAFEGPLDLLLHLIEKNKVDIYDIPIAVITEQYLEYLDEMQRADMDNMSEFLVMAATLLRIKSQMLLPKEVNEEGEEEDPRAELVKRLIEYKVYKYASSELKDLNVEANKCMYKLPTLPEEVLAYREPIRPEEIIAGQGITLLDAKQLIAEGRKENNQQKLDEVKIEDKIIFIRDKIKEYKKIDFQSLLEGQATKVEIIVTFLALLELMKMGQVHVFQEDVGSKILIEEMGEDSL